MEGYKGADGEPGERDVVIAFAAEDDRGLEGMLAGHFGRCPYYVFVRVRGREVGDVEVRENPFFQGHEPGVVPQFVASEGANVIIAGGMGQRAVEWFQRLGVQPVTVVGGKIRDVLGEYLSGRAGGVEPCKGD